MGAKSTDHERAGAASSNNVAPSVQVLIRNLVARASHGAASSATNPDVPSPVRVLIDAPVDGVRCLLVREAPSAATRVSLSPREREIARMIAKGYPNKTIAAVLEISAWTVGTYLRRIFSKLHVSSRAAMVAHLMQIELLDEQSKTGATKKQLA